MEPWLKIAKSLPLTWNKHIVCPVCSSKDARPSASVNNNINTWSIFCYKCKLAKIVDKGVLSLEELKLQKEALARANEPLIVQMPIQASVNFAAPAREWLQKCGISTSVAMSFGLRFNEATQGVILPCYTGEYMNPKLEWIQERGVIEGAPKYRQPSSAKTCTWNNQVMGGKVGLGVVVEDIASAIRISAATSNKVDVHALMGTQINDSQTLRIIRNNNVVLWLDDDKAGHDAARKIKPVLSKFSRVHSLVTDKDPKKYSNEEITKYIMSAVKPP